MPKSQERSALGSGQQAGRVDQQLVSALVILLYRFLLLDVCACYGEHDQKLNFLEVYMLSVTACGKERSTRGVLMAVTCAGWGP